MKQSIRNTLVGWLLGTRITIPERRALADKITPSGDKQRFGGC